MALADPPGGKPPIPCPVCMGAGYWDKVTGHPICTHPGSGIGGLQRCPYCEGERTVRFIPDLSGGRR
jgi:hypothetical protein